MNETDIFLWIAWSFGVFIAIMALIPLVRENRNSYSSINENFIRMMIVLALVQGGGFIAKYLLLNVLGLVEPLIPENLRIDMITSFALLAILLHFSLYATGHHKHYGLPWVWYLFIMIFMIQIGDENSDAPVISSAVVAISLVILFLFKAIKNRSGFMLGVSFYIIVNMIFALMNQYVGKNVVEEEIYILLGFIIGNIVLAFATWGIYDRYLLYDRQKERAIKSTWIAKIMTTSGSKSAASSVQITKEKVMTPVQRRVTCPSCSASKIWLLPGDIMQTREKSQKGILLVQVPVGTTCEHSFRMYIDKSFQVLGYDS